MEFIGLQKKASNKSNVFILRHVVSLSDTNAMGGVVYFSNFIKWQGMARELIMRQKVDYKKLIASPLDMITHSCSAKFLGHLYFGDVVRLEVQTKKILPTSFVMVFEYLRDGGGDVVAVGEQRVTFANRENGELCRMPQEIFDLAKQVELETQDAKSVNRL